MPSACGFRWALTQVPLQLVNCADYLLSRPRRRRYPAPSLCDIWLQFLVRRDSLVAVLDCFERCRLETTYTDFIRLSRVSYCFPSRPRCLDRERPKRRSCSRCSILFEIGKGKAPPFYERVAAKLQVSIGSVKNPDTSLRKQYALLVRDQIARMVSDPGEVDAEFMNFAKVCGREGYVVP